MARSEDVMELAKEQATAKAEFCLRTGVSPIDYDSLTEIEVAAFIKEANKQAERSKRK